MVKEIIRKLKTCNGTVRKLIDQALPKTPLEKPLAVSNAEHRGILDVRNHAGSLFYVLSASRSQAPGCSHTMMLQLATHASHYKTTKSIDFSLLITECDNQSWHDCNICVKVSTQENYDTPVTEVSQVVQLSYIPFDFCYVELPTDFF